MHKLLTLAFATLALLAIGHASPPDPLPDGHAAIAVDADASGTSADATTSAEPTTRHDADAITVATMPNRHAANRHAALNHAANRHAVATLASHAICERQACDATSAEQLPRDATMPADASPSPNDGAQFMRMINASAPVRYTYRAREARHAPLGMASGPSRAPAT